MACLDRSQNTGRDRLDAFRRTRSSLVEERRHRPDPGRHHLDAHFHSLGAHRAMVCAQPPVHALERERH